VLLILSDNDSELLTRELLYTAITRARKKWSYGAAGSFLPCGGAADRKEFRAA
jgi:ATP-dependent exoDNAse (exonuclease V) alpha subunit